MGNDRKDSESVSVDMDTSPSPLPGIGNFTGSMSLDLPKPLTIDEKKYLLAVERGDLANVRRMLQKAHRKHHFNINCMDSLGRGALTLAIDGENLEMVELLVIMGVETRDSLLQAINAEFVEAVELLLEHEELIHKEGEPYSWQKVDINTAMFMPDITPLILAAHRNNYEILKILLDRGATIPTPHDVKCGCDDCIRKSSEDSLRHSLSRVNEYRALASPSLMAISSPDPLLTAFKLSWDLRNLAFSEQECKQDYLDLRRQCQQFAVDLLDQSRSSQELAIVLNHDPEAPPYMDGDPMKLARLEQAIDFKQKKFVAHPNIQQLLAALWYDGVPGFRRKTASQKMMICIRVAVLFPVYCTLYMIAPTCETAELMRKPFMKFLIHASSYLFFLFLLILVSQRAEVQLILMFGTESMRRALEEELLKQRGNGPTYLELLVVVYVLGFIWEETQEIFAEGIQSYLRNMWNFIDFMRNFLYCLVAFLRIFAYIQQTSEISNDPSTAYIAREHWDDFDPQLIAEGLFAAANIFSALKLVHLFSVNPHLGPLQISLGRMVIDIVKFFFIYSLVLFAFACGLNQLLWYFADLEKKKCYSLPGGLPDWNAHSDACMKWRRFGNLFESSQSLFWASFGMVELETFELTGIKSYTRFWGLLMFGSYSVINVIVLLNLLIAMMSNSYAIIDEHSDTEWKFARTKLWMSYFEDSSTLPPPFNIFPTVKMVMRTFGCWQKKKRSIERKSTIRRKEEKEREHRYTSVIRALVWRYVSAMHRKCEEDSVTEDDINEVKMEISAMRYELIEVLGRNGMDVSIVDRKEKTVLAKRMKIWERRLMKDFQVAPVSGELDEELAEEATAGSETGLDRFRRVARQVASNTTSNKWDRVIQDVGIQTNSQIGRCRNRESFKNQQNLLRAMEEARRLVERSPMHRSGSVTPVDIVDPTTNTLMELLKNIKEEIDERSPMNTINLSKGRKSRSTSPAQLVQGLPKSPKPNQSQAEVPKAKVPEAAKVEVQLPPPTIPEIVSPPPQSESTPSLSSPPSVTSPPRITSPPPEILITCPESKSSSPEKKITDVDESQNQYKVIKRKAPTAGDIAVSRPVASKPSPGQGMIPPPPSKVPETPGPSKREALPKNEPPPTPRKSSISSSSGRVSGLENLALDPGISGSREKLVPDKADEESSLDDAKKSAPPSPMCLRPVKRIEDVKTIKRQPKDGWL
ncbi:Transient-receptor-potential-like protein [Sergentomyia squamirostris]